MMPFLQAVLADGRLAIVTADSLRILTNGRWRRVATSDDTDLWFGLRGAGSSFAIVTEFTVSVTLVSTHDQFGDNLSVHMMSLVTTCLYS